MPETPARAITAPDDADTQSHTPTHMPTTNRPINMGKTVADQASRLDGIAKVTGRAMYARDYYMDNSLFVAFIRCPVGVGRMVSADEDAARATPGVVEVTIDRREGTYAGQPVGRIAAESKTALRRAMRALNARWDAGECKTEIEHVMMPPPETSEAAQRALAGADHVLEAVYSTPVQTHSPLETHGAVVDHRGDRAIVYSSTQGVQAAADGLEDALALKRSQYEVRCEYIGGGFGSKLNGAGREGIAAGEVSRAHGRPASCFTDRDEDHLDTGNRPSSRTSVRVGFNNDGTIVGGHIHSWGGVGVARGGGGVDCPSGHYNLGQMQAGNESVQLNAGAPRPFRAPGWPQGKFAEELMVDEIAAICGADPLAIRLRMETSEARKEMYQLGAKLIDWNSRTANGSGRGVTKRGLGMGGTSWRRFPARAEAEVVIHRDGSVVAKTGTQDIGTGMRTVAGVLCAEHLGVPLDHVDVAIGRSTLPIGPGSGGSMTSHNVAPAMIAAAEDAKAKLLDALADTLGEPARDLDLVDGRILQRGEPVMDFAQACAKLPREQITGRGEFSRNGGAQQHLGEGTSDGVQFVDLSVDTETGVIKVNRVIAIQACGRVVCRKTAESQIIGGVIQGLSYALFEHKMLDRNTGSMVNANLEQYKILGTDDTPLIEPVLWTKGQTGVRSLGEPPTIPTAGATACALLNAIGAPVRHLPLTPDKVLDAIEEAQP